MNKTCVSCVHLKNFEAVECDTCGSRYKNWVNELTPLIKHLQLKNMELVARIKLLEVTQREVVSD